MLLPSSVLGALLLSLPPSLPCIPRLVPMGMATRGEQRRHEAAVAQRNEAGRNPGEQEAAVAQGRAGKGAERAWGLPWLRKEEGGGRGAGAAWGCRGSEGGGGGKGAGELGAAGSRKERGRGAASMRLPWLKEQGGGGPASMGCVAQRNEKGEGRDRRAWGCRGSEEGGGGRDQREHEAAMRLKEGKEAGREPASMRLPWLKGRRAGEGSRRAGGCRGQYGHETRLSWFPDFNTRGVLTRHKPP
ncbi:hypothetical protein CYMTET_36402 [Cymbomonas tetramitiformis]|uniref:Uncharacterized protein n=1 Tax=Cymbomonas tetramitiformis TaxID=36881 RepID=A0AAE0F7U7_9CHLO|nr:hypothetical protein CYMTET_36402 [Cymbomonas tetramitiformis]